MSERFLIGISWRKAQGDMCTLEFVLSNPPTEVVQRLGGDTFTVWLPGRFYDSIRDPLAAVVMVYALFTKPYSTPTLDLPVNALTVNGIPVTVERLEMLRDIIIDQADAMSAEERRYAVMNTCQQLQEHLAGMTTPEDRLAVKNAVRALFDDLVTWLGGTPDSLAEMGRWIAAISGQGVAIGWCKSCGGPGLLSGGGFACLRCKN